MDNFQITKPGSGPLLQSTGTSPNGSSGGPDTNNALGLIFLGITIAGLLFALYQQNQGTNLMVKSMMARMEEERLS